MSKELENINPKLLPLCVEISKLKQDPKNARRHSDANIDVIAKSYETYGQQKPVVALEDGTIISGNGQLQAALKLGWKKLARFVDVIIERWQNETGKKATLVPSMGRK